MLTYRPYFLQVSSSSIPSQYTFLLRFSSSQQSAYRTLTRVNSITSLGTLFSVALKHSEFRLRPHHLFGNKHLRIFSRFCLLGTLVGAGQTPKLSNLEYECAVSKPVGRINKNHKKHHQSYLQQGRDSGGFSTGVHEPG